MPIPQALRVHDDGVSNFLQTIKPCQLDPRVNR